MLLTLLDPVLDRPCLCHRLKALSPVLFPVEQAQGVSGLFRRNFDRSSGVSSNRDACRDLWLHRSF